MSQANGEERPDFSERKNAQLEQQAHSAQLREAVESGNVEYLREMVETNLDAATIEVLDNYTAADFVLGNDRERDYHEFKWQLEIKIERVFMRHPPENGIAGRQRAYYYDDPHETLTPLTAKEREIIRAYKDGILKRARRSVGGFQQTKIGETTSRVETVDQDQEDDSRGLFG